MTDAKEIIRRIECSQERDWRREYIRLLPPVPAPTRTPGCTCEWIEERMLCVAGSEHIHAGYGSGCPDHQPPEAIP